MIDVLVAAERAGRLHSAIGARVALLEVGLCEVRGRNRQAVDRALRAIGTTLTRADGARFVQILLGAGRAAARLGRRSEAERLWRRALGAAVATNDSIAHAAALAALGGYLVREGQLIEAGPLLVSAIELQARAGHLQEGMITRLELARLRRRQGLMPEALTLFADVVRIAEHLHADRFRLVGRIERAQVLSLVGRARDARRELLESAVQARRIGAGDLLVRACSSLAVSYARAGDPTRSRVPLALAARILAAADLQRAVGAEHAVHTAEVGLAAQNHATTEALAAAMAGGHGHPLIRCAAMVACGRGMLAAGNLGGAEKALRRALGLLGRVPDASLRGAAEEALGDAQLAVATHPDKRAAARRLRARGRERLERAGVRWFCEGRVVQAQESDLPRSDTQGAPCAIDPDPDTETGGRGPRRWQAFGITTRNKTLHAELCHAARVAPIDLPVLIHGETGCGKELVARAIHRMSRRRGKLVVFNAGTCRNELFEAELFGHRKGAFTGAHRDREGLIVQAENGSLFLDEIADLSSSAQAMLLRFLDGGEVRSVGSDRTRHIRTRIIAASHRNLSRLVARGRFRQDLFFRLAGAEIRIPPLRARREDILPLMRHFAGRRRLPARALAGFLDAGFAEHVLTYPWPGNVRQLSNWVDQLAVLLTGGTPREQIERALERAMRTALRSNGNTALGRSSHREGDGSPGRAELIRLLEARRGNISKVARDLHTYRTHVYRLLRRRGIDLQRYRGSGSSP
jgi:DNA-binding NtrC family response regulator/tetratricopeptide (TPR) repeat protein